MNLTNGIYAVLSGAREGDDLGTKIARTEQLEYVLTSRRFEVYQMQGVYFGQTEPSLLVVLNFPEEIDVMKEWAAKYEQQQIFFANKGVFTAPFASSNKENFSISNRIVFGEEANRQDGCTYGFINQKFVKFSVPDLYEAERIVSNEKAKETAPYSQNQGRRSSDQHRVLSSVD